MTEGQIGPSSISLKPVDIQTHQLNKKRERKAAQERRLYKMKKAAQRKEEEAVKRKKASNKRKDAAKKRKAASVSLRPKTSATYVKVNETTQKERLASKSDQVKTALDSILREAEFTFSRNYTAFFKQTTSKGWFKSLELSDQQLKLLSLMREYRKHLSLSKDLSDMGIFSDYSRVIQDLQNISNTSIDQFSKTNPTLLLTKPEELNNVFQALLERIDALKLIINEAPECSIADAGDQSAAGPTSYPEAAGCADTQECSTSTQSHP